MPIGPFTGSDFAVPGLWRSHSAHWNGVGSGPPSALARRLGALKPSELRFHSFMAPLNLEDVLQRKVPVPRRRRRPISLAQCCRLQVKPDVKIIENPLRGLGVPREHIQAWDYDEIVSESHGSPCQDAVQSLATRHRGGCFVGFWKFEPSGKAERSTRRV